MREFWIVLIVFAVVATALLVIFEGGNTPHFVDDEYRDESNRAREGAVKDE